MGPRLSFAAARLLRAQRDLIADWQARDLGVAPRNLRAACGGGWRQHGHHVFSDREADLTAAQLRVAAFLEFGPDAALTGRAALAEAGWTVDVGDHVDLIVPRCARGRRHEAFPWLRLHTTLEALPARRGFPPRVGNPGATIEAAAAARSSREALLVIVSSAQQRLVTPAQLGAEVRRRGLLPNRRWIVEAVRALDDGATSTAEADFLAECRRRGLPRPHMQRGRVDGQGVRRRTDAEFRTASGTLVVVEIDGVGHLGAAQWQDDLRRHNDLVRTTGGAIWLRVTAWELRNDPDPFFAVLREVLMT